MPADKMPNIINTKLPARFLACRLKYTPQTLFRVTIALRLISLKIALPKQKANKSCNYYSKNTFMKIITLHNRIDIDKLLHYLQQQLNPLFQEQRQSDITFNIVKSGGAIEIAQPELYPGDVLYKIEVDGMNLNITRSEHYVDDVNSLTVESILNDLFKDISGKAGTDLVLEG